MKKILIAISTAVSCLGALIATSACQKDDTPPAHDHVWDQGTVVTKGDCTHDGSTLYTCKICAETKTEVTGGHTWDSGKIARTPTCSATGTRIFTCSVCGEIKSEVEPKDENNHTFISAGARIVTPPTQTEDGEVEKTCALCGAGVRSPIEYIEYMARVGAAKSKAANFTATDFGGLTVATNLAQLAGKSYAATPVTPTVGQHPRVLYTKDDLAGLEAVLHDVDSKSATTLFLTAVANPTTGILPAATQQSDGVHNYSSSVLYEIQDLALDYQLTKNKISGYSAIAAMKNYIKTLDIQKIPTDQERQYGYVMYTAACVYDWCYDLLTTTDKTQIVAGIQHKCLEGSNSYGVKMEIGFPPSQQGAVVGHGSEFQLLRDYLAFAIAIYDEYPGWWDFIGGRFYAEYVPVRNQIYEGQMSIQGASLYLRVRYGADLYSAWLINAMSGSVPYNTENMMQVMRTVYSYELPNGLTFQSGDNHTNDAEFQDYARCALISAYIFDDATMRAQLESQKKSYITFSNTVTMSASHAEYLICSSSGLAPAADRHEDMNLIQYNGGWLGQIIARDSWGSNQAAVLMKIGCKTSGNHDHADSGQFQIFYKTMLAGDTGAYDTYGDNHFKYYHQSTIAHNSLLIVNPNNTTQYYTGGQKRAGEASTDFLTSSSYTMGSVTGVQYAYADEAQTTPTYAYIAGDITAAYDSSYVTGVTRRMLTVYDTDNPDVPMYFFVYDNMSSANGNAKKIFLLHTQTNPTISGNKVTEVAGGAKLVLQNVYGGDVITKVGGSGNNYNVNGTQIAPTKNSSDGFWGRVEISPNAGSMTDRMLNVIYVCDAGKSPALTATSIDTNEVKGTVIGNTAAIFVMSDLRRTTAFGFTSTGDGDLNYYVSGVKEGKWNVTVGGVTQTVTVTKEGGLLTFTAPAGSVSISPAN